MTLLLRATGLKKRYGPLWAVSGIDLDLHAGDVLALFGPNGAGKSSLLHLLGGTARPTSGTVTLGQDGEGKSGSARSSIGLLSHAGFLYGALTARENLRFYARLHGLSGIDARVDEQLERMKLSGRADVPVASLSHGMRRRLALARALIHAPRIVLLDEPYAGLDPGASELLGGVLAELSDGARAVVLVTHNLPHGLSLATRVAICVRGRFAWEGRRSELGPDPTNFYHDVAHGR